MGLDMYAYKSRGVDSDKEHIAYWRKFNALHGWMEKLFRSRGGTGNFNCDIVQLYKEDLERLNKELTSLTPIKGFFFGEQKIYPEDIEDTIVFIETALEAIEDGYLIFYDSWW